MPKAAPNPAVDLGSRRIGFIGAGAVGTTLVRALVESGVEIFAVAAGNIVHAEALTERLPTRSTLAQSPQQVAQSCDLVFLAVSDDEIEPLAERLPWMRGQSVVHFCWRQVQRGAVSRPEHGSPGRGAPPLDDLPAR